MKNLMTFGLVIFAQLLFGFTGFVAAQRSLNSARTQQSQQSSLIGSWQSGDSTLEIRANGTLLLNGNQYSYKTGNSELVISNNNKTVIFPFELSGDYLTVQLSNQRVMYKRAAGSGIRNNNDVRNPSANQQQGGVSSEIVGRWESDKGILEFRAGGTMIINGEQVNYKVYGSAITVSRPQGSLNFPFQISGSQLIMGAPGRRVTYTRIDSDFEENDEREQSFDNRQPKRGIIGRWKSDEATVEIRDDGTLTINGQQYSYRADDSAITISSSEGSVSLPYQFSGDKMVVSIQGRRVIYTRIGNASSGEQNSAGTNRQGSIPQELVGKWCYYASVRPNYGNMRTSESCFTLNADGTYEYYENNHTGGAPGTYTSDTRDSGRWSATATSITAISNNTGAATYQLEKRNHAKNGDPMLVVDGKEFVTFYKRMPWQKWN